jgi:signal transduction histidine kinase
MTFNDLNRVPANRAARTFGASVAHQMRDALLPSVGSSVELERSRLGNLRLRRKHIAMSTVVDLCTEVMGPFVSKRGQRLEVTVDAAPMDVDGDATRLCQVMRHLVANAAAFSACGAEIRVHALRDEDDALVIVTDAGVGIDAQRIETIFAPYLQRHAAESTRRGGLGIGLHVARAILQAHEGSLVAASEGAGLGSTFTLRIPCRQHAAGAAALLQFEPSSRSVSARTAA